MYTILIIDGDPTNWYLKDEGGTLAAAITKQLSEPDPPPVQVPVIYPLGGQLMLSPRAAGNVAILEVQPTVSWIPSDLKAPTAILYVASATGPTHQFPGYELPDTTNVDALRQEIVAAMADGGSVSTPASTVKGSGVVMLDCAVLSFAVICPAPV